MVIFAKINSGDLFRWAKRIFKCSRWKDSSWTWNDVFYEEIVVGEFTKRDTLDK